jgi:hypothetical protein
VLLVYLKILDRVSVGLPVGVAAMVMTMPAVALSNTSILTAMLSHGLVVAVILLALTPRDGWEKQPRKASGEKLEAEQRLRKATLRKETPRRVGLGPARGSHALGERSLQHTSARHLEG